MNTNIARARQVILHEIRNLAGDDRVEMLRLFGEEMDFVHHEYTSFAQGLDEDVRSKAISSEDLADLGFLFREHGAKADDWRKDCKARSEFAGMVIARRLILQPTTDMSGIEDSVKGRYATATMKSEVQPVIPRPSDPEYKEACAYLGVPDELAESKLVKLDWNQAREFVSGLIADGKEVPDIFAKTYPVVGCTYRRRSIKG